MIIRLFLSDRAKNLVAKMEPSKASQYNELKATVLREYKVSPVMYRDRFNSLNKADYQTLRTLLDGYLA